MRIMKSLKSLTKSLVITLMIGANVIGPVLIGPAAMASETTYGVLNLSGSVPEIFRLDMRGASGDIDLNGGDGTTGTAVSNRVLGIFHIKINIDMASFTLQTANASGTFETGAAAAYPFSVAMTMAVDAACTTLNPATTVTANALGLAAGVDIIRAAGQPSVVTRGVEEDCQLLGNWTNQTAVIPLAGVYFLPIVATMVSV